jgi:hypothetical protein
VAERHHESIGAPPGGSDASEDGYIRKTC